MNRIQGTGRIGYPCGKKIRHLPHSTLTQKKNQFEVTKNLYVKVRL